MPRIRSLHPGFWSDEKVMSLTFVGRLLFMGIWSFADDAGRIEANVLQLKALIFPADDLSRHEIGSAVDQLVSLGVLHKYEVEQKTYLHCPHWGKYQSPRFAVLKFPEPTCCSTTVIEPLKEGVLRKEGVLKGTSYDTRTRTRTRTMSIPPVSPPLKKVGATPRPEGDTMSQREISKTEVEWVSPEWFKPMTELDGYKVGNHEKSVQVLNLACATAKVEVADLVRAFATKWPELRLIHGRKDPVAFLVRTRGVEISMLRGKAGANGVHKGSLPKPEGGLGKTKKPLFDPRGRPILQDASAFGDS